MLEHHGFHVLTATDGREAIKLFQKHVRDIVCVLLDMTMPHMDGEETCHELFRIRKDVRVIIASGYSEQEIAKRFTDHQLAGFIEKPYEATTLMAKLRDALGTS
jgi:CheY-like chemotaxis protein